MLPDASGKEIKNNLKVMLTNMKLRKVPIAKKRSERTLSRLYREERELGEQIKELETNLAQVSQGKRRTTYTMLEVRPANHGQPRGDDGLRPAARVTQLTEAKIDEWETTLKAKREQLDDVRKKIAEAKEIIKNPEDYVSVPTDYGRDPAGQRAREKELLVKDRENMSFREQVQTGQVAPLWITDSF